MTATATSEHENRRREYLALMGIQPWYARVVLENAKPSPVLPASLPQSRQARKSDQQAHRPDDQAHRSGDQAPRPDPRAPRPAAETAEAAVVVARGPLHYLRIDDSLALLAQDAWEGPAGAECRDLLANILKALGRTLAAGAETVGPQRCSAQAEADRAHMPCSSTSASPPAQAGASRDGSPEARRRRLDERGVPASADAGQGDSLEDLCRRDRCPNLLIFAHDGSELFPRVAAATTDFPRLVGGVSTQVTITRGLREMLAFPDLKKYCWRDLQPLRTRLGRLSGMQAPDQARDPHP